MPRFALGVEYAGHHYHGWQVQPNTHSVQGYCEHALSRIADHPVAIVCAGRTDAGVHATGQVIHFDSSAERPLRAWRDGTNKHLPDDIRITFAHAVPDVFHARFSASTRRYEYWILNDVSHSALLSKRLTQIHYDLDVSAMQAAATYLEGLHDFSSFRAAGCQAHTAMRHVKSLQVHRQGTLIGISIEANAFLYHMVRNIVAVLIKIGRGQASPAWAQEILKAQDRTQAPATAPAHGLYLSDVFYPSTFKLPQARRRPFFNNLLAE